MKKILQIEYGNGFTKKLVQGDHVMISYFEREYYVHIPDEVKEKPFTLIDFTKKNIPKLLGCDNHVYIVRADAIETIQEYNESLAVYTELSHYEPEDDFVDYTKFKIVDNSNLNYDLAKNARKIYSNDPCPCGSGKKYKKCCRGKFNEHM